MRVLMFATYFPPQYSGAAKQAISLAKHLRTRGHHIEFATVRWPGLSETDEIEGFSVRRLEAGRGMKHQEFRLWWNLFRYIWVRRQDFDILHSHGAYYRNSVVGPLARLTGCRSIVKASMAGKDFHGLGQSLFGRIHSIFLREVDAYVAISHDLYRESLSVGFPSEKVYHVPNGVDTERFRPVSLTEKRRLRRELGLPLDNRLALTVGVFDRRKNIGWLLENWAQYNAFGTDILLLAVGPRSRGDVDGEFLMRLKDLAVKHPKILQVRDYSEKIEKYYQASDLFILSSHNEGLPNVIVEAMACGLPCVASRVSGTRELVEEGKSGFTFAVDDVQDLRKALLNVLGPNNKNLGIRASQRIEKEFSFTVIAEEYDRLYKRLSAET